MCVCVCVCVCVYNPVICVYRYGYVVVLFDMFVGGSGVIGENLEAQSTYVHTYVHMKNPKIVYIVYI